MSRQTIFITFHSAVVNGSGVSRDMSTFSIRLRSTSDDYKYSHTESAVNDLAPENRDCEKPKVADACRVSPAAYDCKIVVFLCKNRLEADNPRVGHVRPTNSRKKPARN